MGFGLVVARFSFFVQQLESRGVAYKLFDAISRNDPVL